MKPMFLISCPIDTYSGYGARSRDLVKAIIKLDKFDVKILPQRWGNTPWGFIEDHKDWHFLQSHILTNPQLPKKPEIWAQVTVPNEFQPMGKFNIGFTAGIETTVCAPQWIEGLNRMDLNIVSSEHAKTTFINSKFEQKDQKTNQTIRTIELLKPIEVLFEGADLETYLPKKSEFDLSMVKEDFAYLFVGHWMQGDLGEDRKNVGFMIKCFFEAFKNKTKVPALILKTSSAGASYIDRENILNKIDQIRSSVDARKLPNIYLIHGELSNKEINELYNHKKVKAMVSLTKGEGFGRPLLEFSLTKKPIITTNWSGHLDFLNSDYVTLINGELKNVHKSAAVKDMILEDSQWFTPNFGETGYYFRDIFENYKSYKEKAVRQAHISKTQFSFTNMVDKLGDHLNQFTPDFPKEVKLQLPQLKTPKLPQLKKVKFPNL
jgi:hypothetical protein